MVRTEEYVVIVFDVCSSSSIVDMFTHSNNAERLVHFYGCIKRWLWDQSDSSGGKIIPYKFIGDGWIVLMRASVTGEVLCTFVRRLCEAVNLELENHVDPFLDLELPLRGVTIGVDVGPLLGFNMFSAPEYIGRSINLACRLQGATNRIQLPTGGNAAYKAFVSARAFEEYFRGPAAYLAIREVVPLRNVSHGQPVKAWLVDLLRDPDGKELALPDRAPYAPAPCVASRPR